MKIPANKSPASWSGFDPCSDTAMMRQRIALFARVVFFISLGFYALGMAIVGGLLGTSVWAMVNYPGNIAHLAGVAGMGATWLVTAWVGLDARALRGLEAAAVVLCCTAWALMLDDNTGSGDGVLLALSLTVISRAVIVPSSALRTFALTALAFAPLLVVHYLRAPVGIMKVIATINVVMWAASATAVATVASRIIYGLRREVAAARDIGQYTLEEKLGAGGMGEVWRARHRLLIRPAAIKIISGDALGATGGPEVAMRRFEREARATAALRSPHTVQLYDFGMTEDGRLYYVMEMLEGLDLETMVRRYGPVPAERAIHILIQVCASLVEAHRAGLVHRDIKPANLFLMRAGAERDFVKVLDFGLVKLGHSRTSRDSLQLTADGTVTGTPAYMAPELVLGVGEDQRADLYSLGCVAYWLVTGKTVFDGETAMAVMLHHVHSIPPPPSERSELTIPPELERLILDCLAKDPDRRPQTAAELAARLGSCAVATAWTAARAERWWQLHLPEPTEPRPIADMLLSREGRNSIPLVRGVADGEDRHRPRPPVTR